MRAAIKPEEGKKYKLRNGITTGVITEQENNTSYKFTALVQEQHYPTPTVMHWLDSGRFLTNNIDNRYDIIEEAE